MTAKFGNLTVNEMEQLQEINLPNDVRAKLELMRQNDAQDIMQGRFHIFRFPFVIDCGDEYTAREVIEILTPYGDKMAMHMQVIG
jgi:hypothetical protein